MYGLVKWKSTHKPPKSSRMAVPYGFWKASSHPSLYGLSDMAEHRAKIHMPQDQVTCMLGIFADLRFRDLQRCQKERVRWTSKGSSPPGVGRVSVTGGHWGPGKEAPLKQPESSHIFNKGWAFGFISLEEEVYFIINNLPWLISTIL